MSLNTGLLAAQVNVVRMSVLMAKSLSKARGAQQFMG